MVKIMKKSISNRRTIYYWISVLVIGCITSVFIWVAIYKIVSYFNLIKLSSMGVITSHYYSQVAIIGVVILCLPILVTSLKLDLMVIQEKYKDGSQKWIMQWINDALKISLSILLGVYWYNRILYFWTKNINIVLDVSFIGFIWPLLLLTNLCLVTIFNINEPWKKVLPIRRNLTNNNVTSKYRLLMISLYRVFSYVVIYFIFALFATVLNPQNSLAIIGATCLFFLMFFALRKRNETPIS